MSRQEHDGSATSGPLGGRFRPLPFAFRLDISLRTGGREKARATWITWVTPRGASNWVKGLEIILLPN